MSYMKQVLVTEMIVVDSESEKETPFAFASVFNASMNVFQECTSKQDIKGKGRDVVPPSVENPTPKKKGGPKKKSEEYINEQSGPEVSQHMSGARILIPSTFSGNPEATVYYNAVSAGSITALSHATMYSLHVSLCGNCWMTISSPPSPLPSV